MQSQSHRCVLRFHHIWCGSPPDCDFAWYSVGSIFTNFMLDLRVLRLRFVSRRVCFIHSRVANRPKWPIVEVILLYDFTRVNDKCASVYPRYLESPWLARGYLCWGTNLPARLAYAQRYLESSQSEWRFAILLPRFYQLAFTLSVSLKQPFILLVLDEQFSSARVILIDSVCLTTRLDSTYDSHLTNKSLFKNLRLTPKSV